MASPEESHVGETNRHRQAARLMRSLLALPELKMRTAWLGDHLSGDRVPKYAAALDSIAESAQTTNEEAREAMLVIAMLVAGRRDSSWLWALREIAKSESLLNLERLLRELPRDENTDLTPLLESDTRIPDYGKGRELTVGERRTLARRPTRAQLEKLLLDPHELVIAQLLDCPNITEQDVLLIATRRPARLSSLELIAASPRWMARRRVRMSLILNPATPHALALPYVSTCLRDELRLIASATTISTTLRSVAHELFSRLPPLAEASTHRLHQ